jgi:hypothetical protein
LLAYEAKVGKHYQLFTSKADGSGAHQLTHFADSDAVWAAWSPSGSQIAFERDVYTGVWVNHAAIYTMNANGRSVCSLTPTGLNGCPKWACPSDHQGTAARARQPLARSQVYVDASADDAPKAPDIVSVTVANDDSGQLTLTVSFANRPVLLPSDLLVVGLDVDRDRRTGGPVGMDYALSATTAGAELGVWSSSSWSGSGYVRVPGAATLSVSDHSLALSTTVDQLGALMALQRPQLLFVVIAIAGTDQPEQSWADDVAGPWTYQLKLPTKPRARACG